MTSPATLFGASRRWKRRYARWMRKRDADRIGYVPPRGVTVDWEADGAVSYQLSDPQSTVFESAKRFRVLIAGRRFGKTHYACVEMITFGLEHPGAMVWYVAPTYDMARDIAWETLKALIPPWLLARKPNESRLTVQLINGARIQLKGAEHPNRLRGRALAFVVLDEFPMMKEAVWTEAIRPSLADLQGGALFIGTPMGYNWGYDLFQLGHGIVPEGRDDLDVTEWGAWQFTTAEGGRVKPEELASARALLDPRLYKQEFEASFETLAGRVYRAFDRAVHVQKFRDPGGMIRVGIDFNVNPMTCVIAAEQVIDGLRTILILDAWELADSSTEDLAIKLREVFPQRVPDPARPGETKPGRFVLLHPDPAGRARSTKAKTGQTDFTILESFGFTIDAPNAAPLVKDRINNANANLKSADGTVRVLVHERAKPITKALEGLTFKGNVPDPKSPLIHITDAFGYLLWQASNLLDESGVWRTSRRTM